MGVLTFLFDDTQASNATEGPVSNETEVSGHSF